MPLNLAGGYGAGGGFDAMMELREAVRRELQDKALQKEAADRLEENARQFNTRMPLDIARLRIEQEKAPVDIEHTKALTADVTQRPAHELLLQKNLFGNQQQMQNAGFGFTSEQNALGRAHETGMQKTQLDFTGGENLKDRTFRTSERLGGQTFTRGENAADRASRVNLMNLQNAGDIAAAQFRADIGRPITGEQRQTRDFYTRMRSALDDMDKYEAQLSAKDVAIIQGSPLPEAINNMALSEAGRKYSQAMRAYTLAKLRQESGAAISAGEFTKEGLIAGRAIGDDPGTLAQKRKTREGVAEGFAASSGRAYDEFYGKPFDRTGVGVKKRVKVQSADGKQSGEVDEDEVKLLPAGWRVVGGG